jgi:electron transport complex protein RnfB
MVIDEDEIKVQYQILAKKLDEALQGLSPLGTVGNVSDTWMEYLRTLVDPGDVQYLNKLPVFPGTITVKKFSKRIEKSEEVAAEILERLFKSDCVMQVGSTKKRYGIHLPLLIFDVPPLSYDEMPKEKAKKLAELSLKYLIDEQWYRNFEGSSKTPLTRVIPVQESLQPTQEILSYESVEEIVKNARILGLQKCACRVRMNYLGLKKCDYPIETCISVNQGAQYFIDRGHAKEITKDEALKLLKKFNKMGLVHTTENYGDHDHSLICNCCACCCSLIGGITRWENPRAVAKANFIVSLKDPDSCTQCGTCVEMCNFKALSLGDTSPEIDPDKCMGCGVCVVNCPAEVLELKRKEREVIYKDLIQLGLKVAAETNRKIKF